MFFELSRAGEVESGMASDGIVEPIDVAANSPVGLLAGVEDSPPDELGFQALEERLPHGVVVAIPPAGHRDQDAGLLELGLIVDRAVLAAAILPGFKWSSQRLPEPIVITRQVPRRGISRPGSCAVWH